MKKLLPLSITFMLLQSPALAETCKPLIVVGGDASQTLVQKTVDPPQVPISIGRLYKNNWNTDFAVVGGQSYKRYGFKLTPQSEGTYSIRVYLKYSDGTADEIYNKKPDLSSGKPVTLSVKPRANNQPYQVNVFVGDTESVGKSYSVLVQACK